MTFSWEVREELAKIIPKARHCRIAEFAVLFLHYGTVEERDGQIRLVLNCEQESIARKCFTLAEKTFNISVGLLKTDRLFRIEIAQEEAVTDILSAVKLLDGNGKILANADHVSHQLVKTQCCMRAFLRACYICCGSISDPAKGYHLEFVCQSDSMAEMISQILGHFDIEAKTVLRKKYRVVYLKEGSAIVEVLNIMEAHISMMNLENYRILHEIAGETNRRVNCETANLLKSVNAANSQIEDIEFIARTVGLNALPPALQEMAEVRLEHRDATLKELGEFLSPSVGKSGVNHRLRKIQEYATKLKG